MMSQAPPCLGRLRVLRLVLLVDRQPRDQDLPSSDHSPTSRFQSFGTAFVFVLLAHPNHATENIGRRVEAPCRAKGAEEGLERASAEIQIFQLRLRPRRQLPR
eukprot:scaffold2664_cov267-Pinguiococcus_pyrenoidosus.AAC.3